MGLKMACLSHPSWEGMWDSSWSHVGPNLEPCWTNFGALILEPCWTKVGAMLDQLWSHVGPSSWDGMWCFKWHAKGGKELCHWSFAQLGLQVAPSWRAISGDSLAICKKATVLIFTFRCMAVCQTSHHSHLGVCPWAEKCPRAPQKDSMLLENDQKWLIFFFTWFS